MPLPRPVTNSITYVGVRAIAIMFFIWLLLMLISLYHDAGAHAHDAQHMSDWIGDQAYKSPNGEACCGLGDCAMLDDDAVTPVPGGYAVHGSGTYFLAYGPYGSRRERFDETVPAAETLISQDDHYWRCGSYYGGFTRPNQRRCFFIKPSLSEAPSGGRGAG
jgi:hypothetical protein